MKVAIFVHSLSGGGAEHVAALWARGFSEKGQETSVIVFGNSHDAYHLPESVKLFEIEKPQGSKIVRYTGKILRVRKVFKQIKPDVIICVMHPCGLYAWLATIGMHIPIINTEHNSFVRPEGARWSKVELFQKKYVNHLFQHITVLTQKDKELIEKRFKNVSVLPNPLAFKPVKEIPAKQKIVLAMGRLDAWFVKGFDLLIKSWGLVSKQHPDWKLIIVGGGSKGGKEKLKELCDGEGVSSSVEIFGHTNSPEEFYLKASIFVLSSRCDGFGMVLIEAMSQGCACIACDFEGRQKEIIRTEEEGLLCEVGNVEQLAAQINMLIENQPMRETVQKKAIERSSDFSILEIMNKWDKILKTVIK